MPPIALLTDFGTRDWFVASMKGIIKGINPAADIIDITHEIEPGNIRDAAFALMACYQSFPPGTVFLVVVDPGVGGSRHPLGARVGDYFLAGPDNGVLSFVLNRHPEARVWTIENKAWFHTPLSVTFHGRDIFAPVGAHLSLGDNPNDMGLPCVQFEILEWLEVRATEISVIGSIIYIDRFGNAFSNLDTAFLHNLASSPSRVIIQNREPIPVCRYYQEQAKGKALALINSSGFLEIAVNGGSAAEVLDLSVGTVIEVL